MTMCTID